MNVFLIPLTQLHAILSDPIAVTRVQKTAPVPLLLCEEAVDHHGASPDSSLYKTVDESATKREAIAT